MTTHLPLHTNVLQDDAVLKQMELQLFVSMVCEETTRECYRVAKLRSPAPSEEQDQVIH